MELETIENTLAKANLALQPSMYSKIHDFLQNQIGLTSTYTDYDVFSALAIIGQVLKVKPVDDSEEVESGIHIQTVMRHLGNLSKETLLEQVMKKCQKWREAPLWLKTKIEAVNMTYRIYKKYRALFQKLVLKVGSFEIQSLYNIISIFWIVFLYVKNKNPEIDNALEVTKLLKSLFLFVFREVIKTQTTQMRDAQINKLFFQEFGPCQPTSDKVYDNYRQKMLFQLQNAYQFREQDIQKMIDLRRLVTNDIFVMRLADDIDNLYEKYKITLPLHTVDEISYLEVDKTLTPLSIKRNIINSPGIVKRMNLYEDDNDDNDDQPDQNEPMEAEHVSRDELRVESIWPTKNKIVGFSRKVIPLSPFRPTYKETPLSARNQNLSWVNRNTQSCEKENMEQIQYIYEKYQGNNYEKFKNKALNNIKTSIYQFTPSCMDGTKRQRTIYSFFASFIRKIHDKHLQNEREIIFSNSASFQSVLCLSTNLLNYAYQSLQSSFRQYCSIFGITLIEGQIPINWFGLSGDTPKNIQGYLYDLEKKIMIQELWEGEEGYKLLLQTGKYYKQNAILKRLKRHVDERSAQLCEAMKIDLKQKTYVMNLMRFILDKRPGLLRDHKIDQIVVCSITSVLNINRSKMDKPVPLQEIVSHYNKLVYSWNINKSIFYDEEGNELNLLDYYNNVFLEQIDEIISNEEQAQSILNTPVRLERKTSSERGIQMTPISIKFKQAPNEAFGSKKFKADVTDGNSYRHKYAQNYSRLASTLKKLDINDPIAQKEEAVQDDEHPSPSFGGKSAMLFRTYSFGDFGDQY